MIHAKVGDIVLIRAVIEGDRDPWWILRHPSGEVEFNWPCKDVVSVEERAVGVGDRVNRKKAPAESVPLTILAIHDNVAWCHDPNEPAYCTCRLEHLERV